MRGPDSRAA